MARRWGGREWGSTPHRDPVSFSLRQSTGNSVSHWMVDGNLKEAAPHWPKVVRTEESCVNVGSLDPLPGWCRGGWAVFL